MPTQTLEERVAVLETEVACLKNEAVETTENPWWEEIRGIFKDDPAYVEAMQYGREYRESLRPKDEGDSLSHCLCLNSTLIEYC